MTSIFMSCESKKEVSKEESNVSYAKFGDSISSENAINNSEMMEKIMVSSCQKMPKKKRLS